MQTQATAGFGDAVPRGVLDDRSLYALLALVGSKRIGTSAIRGRTGLSPATFGSLLDWLQREYLVDVVSTLAGPSVEDQLELTERGEALLLAILERTCELPELR